MNYYHWTQSARECYEIGCRCNNCLLYIILGKECRMKQAVFELVRKFGAPKEKKFTKSQQKILDAIQSGATTWDEIAEQSGLSRDSVIHNLQDLYKIAEGNGISYKNKRNKLTQFIEWVTENYRR